MLFPRWMSAKYGLSWKVLTLISIVAWLCVIYFIWSLASGHDWHNRHRVFIHATKQLQGKAEKEAIKTLGRPTKVIHVEQVKKGIIEYPMPGYAQPKRSITHKVLIYIKGDAIFYIYVDHKGFIEDTFYGPS